MSHTPVPWKASSYPVNRMTQWVIHSDDGSIASLVRSNNADANAEFIVRACNAHEDLLKASKAIAQFAASNPWTGLKDAPKELLANLTAAIRKAEWEPK